MAWQSPFTSKSVLTATAKIEVVFEKINKYYIKLKRWRIAMGSFAALVQIVEQKENVNITKKMIGVRSIYFSLLVVE